MIGLVGLYYTGIRQIYGALLVCMAFPFIKETNKRFFRIFIGLIVIIVLSGNLFLLIDKLFGSMIDLTMSQLTEDYIRIISGKFFLIDYYEHWLNYIFGNGVHYFKSSYGKEIEYYKEFYNYYKSDVGLIGALNEFGIIYILLLANIYIKIFRTKLIQGYKFISTFFLFTLLISLTSYNYFSKTGTIPIFAILFYLVEILIVSKNKFNENINYLTSTNT